MGDITVLGVEIRPLDVRLLRVTATPGAWRNTELQFHFEVLDRDTAEPRRLVFNRSVYNSEVSAVGAAQLVRRALHEFFYHEVDELLFVDGERVNDPHAESQRAAEAGRGKDGDG